MQGGSEGGAAKLDLRLGKVLVGLLPIERFAVSLCSGKLRICVIELAFLEGRKRFDVPFNALVTY